MGDKSHFVRPGHIYKIHKQSNTNRWNCITEEKDLTLEKVITAAQSLQVADKEAHKIPNTSLAPEGTIDVVL